MVVYEIKSSAPATHRVILPTGWTKTTQVENDFSTFKGGFKYLDFVCTLKDRASNSRLHPSVQNFHGIVFISSTPTDAVTDQLD